MRRFLLLALLLIAPMFGSAQGPAVPVARSVVVTTTEGAATNGALLATDADGDSLTFTIVTPPTKGSLVVTNATTGAFTYTPNTGAIGYDSFVFRAADGGGRSSSANGAVFVVTSAPRWPGQTVRASMAPDGSQLTSPSTWGAMPSADGRFVVFSTGVIDETTGTLPNVYVLDRQTGQTTLVSKATGSEQPIGGVIPWMTQDGRYVVFMSLASSLPGGSPTAVIDQYLHDRQTGETTRVSVASDGTAGNGDSGLGSISADGRYAAFSSVSTNLSPTDANGDDDDVFVRDLQTGVTTLVSVSSAGVQGNSGSWRPTISADGRFVAFNSSASNLVPNDTNDAIDLFVRDLWTSQTTRVSVGTGGTQANDDTLGAISDTGRFVLLSSRASTLVPGDTNGFGDVFVRDLQTGQTTRVSVSSSGAQGNNNAEDGTISADGRFVAFRSWASNLVPGDTNGLPDEFVHDRLTGQTVRINVASDGTLANNATTSTADDDGCCIGAIISADGRSIVFTSLASNLVPGDTNNTDDVFVVGPVSVTPAAMAVPAAGGSRAVDVAFDFPGTPWTATTTTPWITLTPPVGGSASGTVNFTVAANTGASRTGTIVAALQTVTVTQDAGNVTALAVANASGTFGGTTTLTATLTLAGNPFAGQQVSFALNGTSVGSATTDASGIAILAGASLAGINAGTYVGGVQATYAGDGSSVGSTGNATLTVARGVPALTWPTPASIVTGTPLSSLHLNATASVPGTFTYAPPFGTLLPIGVGHVLSVTFTPANTTNYTAAQAQVAIDVTPVGTPSAATFQLIGDLPGGPVRSVVRDATRVGSTVYAVGGAAANNQVPCVTPNVPPGCVPQLTSDTSVIWTSDGTGATLTALPSLVSPAPVGVTVLSAAAITRNGAFIASQARSNASDPAQMLPVRVTREGLSNVNLGAPPFLGLNQPASAQAISEDGAIVYAVSGIPQRAFRFDLNASSRLFIPLLPTHNGNIVASRGTSFDGSVMVGTSFVFPFTGTNGRAFRYVHGSPTGTVSAIPLLAGGTWNKALAVSPDGRRTLVAGNSTHLPNGEMYLHDAVTGATTALGSPNTPWTPTNLAGMTADGSVVVATFVDGTHAYVRNAHGWFHLTTVLAAQGINLASMGLQIPGMHVNGISPDGTLVFGTVEHPDNDDVEGFVAEFAPGYLASFDVPAVPQTDSPIVGIWTGTGDDANDEAIAFLADGTYVAIDPRHGSQPAGDHTSGFERGRYHWEAATGAFTFATLQDTNGSVGFSGGNGFFGIPASVSGDTLDIANGAIVLSRVSGGPTSIVGGWVFGDPRVDNDSGVLVLFPNGAFMFAEDGDSAADPSGHDGIEAGTYSWVNGVFTATLTLDTNGEWGFGDGPGTGSTLPLQLSADGLRLVSNGQVAFTRAVHPQTVVPVITSPLTATGIAGLPFAYTITATHGETFNATGLPSGLAVNTATGQISGTPTTAGTFVVTISATNSFNNTTSAQLTITVLAPTALAVANASGTFGGTTTLSVTLTSGATPLAGQQVSFSLNGTSVGTATTNGSGVATIDNVSLAGINAGTYATGVQATFAGNATHASSTGSASLTIARAVPILTWPAPAAIVHGTPLGATQLNATANVPGTFVYTPAAGTILPAGLGQTLSVLFTPASSVNYTTAQAQVAIDVLNAAPVARGVVVTTQEGVTTSGTLLATDLENDPLTFSVVSPPTRGTLTLLNASTGAFTYTPNAGTLGYDSFTFRASEGSGASSTALGSIFIVAATPRWPGQTTRVNIATNGTQANGASNLGATLSADGRFVVFASAATNLSPGIPAGSLNIYLRDRQTGQTELVSVASAGGPAIGGALPIVSGDGRYIGFTSLASALPGGHPQGSSDAYLHDRQTGVTERISVAANGQGGNGDSLLAVASADGRYVTFYSNASNLVANDANGNGEDVFLRDRQLGTTTLISRSSAGVQGNSSSWAPSFSADGRFVAFQSEASNLVPNDTNARIDVFVRDLRTGQTTRVSVGTGGTQSNGDTQGTLSTSGRFVVLSSSATNLVPGDTNGFGDVFIHDRQTGQTTRVSVSSAGTQGNGNSEDATVSADGRFVAFRSWATNLVPGDTNGLPDEFVHDRLTGQTVRINVASDGTQASAAALGDEDGCCITPVISGDGRSIVILSAASNLVAGDTNGVDDVFVVGPVLVTPTTINAPGAGGTRSVNVSVDYPGPWTASTTTPWITINPPAGGSTSGALSFTVAPNAGVARTGTLLVALQTVTVNQEASSAPVALNGTLTVAEDTTATGTLNATDPNGDSITFSVVSPAAHGTVTLTNPSTGAYSYTPALNFHGADSFTFQATAGGETSNVATVSITVTPVNDAPVAVDGTLAAIEDTPAPGTLVATDVEGDALTFSIVAAPSHGTVVITNAATGAFTYTPAAEYLGPDSFTFRASDASSSSNIATVRITSIAPVNDAPVATNVVVTTREGVAQNGFLLGTDIDGPALTFSIVTPPARGTLTLLNAVTGEFTYTPNAGAIGYDAFTFQISDGLASTTAPGAVFVVAASPRWPGQTVRVSVATGGGQSNVGGIAPAVTADGRYIAFESTASNLVAGDTNNVFDVFVHDRQTGQTTRVSVASNGAQANNASRQASLSADGRYVAFFSAASNLVPGDTNGLNDVFVHDRQTGQTTRVSVSSAGAQGNDFSQGPVLSADGRYVAFESAASTLTTGDTNGTWDIYVHDRQTAQTTRVSVATGAVGGNNVSLSPALSADGRYVVFQSDSSNLVTGDTNGLTDIFVHDRQTGQTERVSVSGAGAQADSVSSLPNINADGRYVTFASFASNLVAGDTNGVYDVFVRDRQTGATTRASVASDGTEGTGGDSTEPAVSADGRYVTFLSRASNLVAGDSNARTDVFVHDRQTAITTRVGVASSGAQGDRDSFNPMPSADGRFIAFGSDSSNVVAGDTNALSDIFVVGGVSVSPTAFTVPGSGGTRSVNVSFDYPGTSWTVTTTTPWITIVPPAGGSSSGGVTFTVAPNTGFARTGTLVVALQTVTVTQEGATAPLALNGTLTLAEDTIASGTLNATDPNGDAITFSLVSPGAHGTVTLTNPSTGAYSYTPAPNFHGADSFTFQATAGGETSNVATVSITVTPVNDAPMAVDGTLAAIEDTPVPGTLVATDVDGDALTFAIVTPPAHGTVVVTNATTGAFTYTPAAEYLGPDSFTFRASDASLGSNVATVRITSIAPVNDVPVANNVVLTTREGVAQNGFLLGTDIDGPALTFSIVTPPLRGTLTLLNAVTGEFTYTPNAGVVGFDSFTFRLSDSLASSTATGAVFIVTSSPRWPGQTVRVSVAADGTQGNASSFGPSISADGRYVAFSSFASTIVPGDTNGRTDVFVHDRMTGTRTRVSAVTGGGQSNGDSQYPSISADARFVAFTSSASNLVAGDTNNRSDIFVHDRQTGETSRVSVASDGTQANLDSNTGLAISADGRYVAFSSMASNLVAGDTNGVFDIFVRDRQAGTTSRVSVASNGSQGNGDSVLPAMSADGRFVAFQTSASNLGGGAAVSSNVYLHDREARQTTRASTPLVGSAASAGRPTITADGRLIAFYAFDSSLVPGDTNGVADVFLYDRDTGITRMLSITNAGTLGNDHSRDPYLSADGRFVGFVSWASNMVAGDTNGFVDAFVRDLVTGQSVRVNVANDGTQSNAPSGTIAPILSADARFVTFSAGAGNLVPSDTNNQEDVFVVGGVSVSPTTVSVAGAGGARSVNVSFEYPGTPWTATTTAPWITVQPPAGGSASGSVNFTVASNTGAARTGTIVAALQTVTVHQEAASAPVALDGSFTTAEDTLFAGALSATDPNGDALTFTIVTPPLRGTVVITDPLTGAFTYTPNLNQFGGDSFTFQASDGDEVSNVATVSISITMVNDAPSAHDVTLDATEDTQATGFFVAGDPDSFVVTFAIVTPPTHGTVSIPNPTTRPLGGTFIYTPNANYHGPDSFTYRVIDGTLQSNVATVSISVASVNDPPVAATDLFFITREGVALSGSLLSSNVDGEALTYEFVTSPLKGSVTITNATTGAFTYAPNAGATGYDTFAIRAVDSDGASSTAAGSVMIAAAAPRWPGQTVRASVSTSGAQGAGLSSLSSISADGRFVAFYSAASNLVAGDTNGQADVFVRDRQTGQTTRVSVGFGGAQANGSNSDQAMSADGRFVAFNSTASNLVPVDTNAQTDVFVHDRQTGLTTLVSRTTGGAQGNGPSLRPDMSADGRYVTFDSFATNLVPGDTNAVADVFVHDRQTGQTTRVSVASNGAQANGQSLAPSISANGRYLVFNSSASNLVPGDTNSASDTFVHDRQTGQTTRVSVATGGAQGNNAAYSGSEISGDGRYVAFISGASNLVPSDTNNQRDVFVHDRQLGQTALVSVANDGTQQNAHGLRLSISADGRYVAFDSSASNLVPDDSNGRSDVFVHDRETRRLTRVSVSGAGLQGNNGSAAPALSADGAFIAFDSDATTLAVPDVNGSTGDIYVVGGASVTPSSVNVGSDGGTRSVTVSFAYPGTAWTAATSTPWITLTPPVGGTGNGSVTFSVAPNLGAARTGAIAVALQTVTVTQDAYVDVTRPTVTPPADISIYATVPGGATPATVPALAQFLAGATAVDDATPSPVQQPSLLNGAAITPATVFALGTNTVTFSFTDEAGNVGTAMATVTVLGGRPQLAAAVASIAGEFPDLHVITLRVSNNGTGNALNVNLALSNLRVLVGSGTLTLVSGLPASIPQLAPGQTSTAVVLRVYAPPTVQRFAITEALTTTDYAGAVISTTATQTIFPIDVYSPTFTLGPRVTNVTPTTITISWDTNEPATSRLDWGIGTSTNRVVPEDSVYKTTHSVTLTGLLPNTTYSFIASGRDRAGNRYSSSRRTQITSP